MRSIKENYVVVEGCKMIRGKVYLLDFPNRSDGGKYIFVFDHVYMNDSGGMTIYHRDKWINDGGMYHVSSSSGYEPMVSFPNCEGTKLSRYHKVINWDEDSESFY